MSRPTTLTAPAVRDWLWRHDPDLTTHADLSAGAVADLMIEAGAIENAQRSAAQRYVSRMRNGKMPPLSEDDVIARDEAAEVEVDSAPVSVPEAEGDSPLLDLERDYIYREEADVYVLYLPHRPKAQVVRGETIRAMKEAYSRWTGDEHTINEICRTFGVTRRDFVALKTAMGWTHDSAPFTDETLASKQTDELVADLARMRERDLEIEDNKRESGAHDQGREALARKGLGRALVRRPGRAGDRPDPARALAPSARGARRDLRGGRGV